jgi:hypothetical protein
MIIGEGEVEARVRTVTDVAGPYSARYGSKRDYKAQRNLIARAVRLASRHMPARAARAFSFRWRSSGTWRNCIMLGM